MMPSRSDIKALISILDMFVKASGLCTNIQKSEIFPIGCVGLQLEQILEAMPIKDFPCCLQLEQILEAMPIKDFPCCYLGLPLHLKKLRKIDFIPLIDKVGGKLPSWKGKLMSKAARAQLVKSVLMAIVTYHVMVFNLLKWLIKRIDKLRRNFYWKGEDAQGHKGRACLVKWGVVCRPKDLGDLGIHELNCFGRVL
jgi:hypothetical protein